MASETSPSRKVGRNCNICTLQNTKDAVPANDKTLLYRISSASRWYSQH
jgi:hypothetical protein